MACRGGTDPGNALVLVARVGTPELLEFALNRFGSKDQVGRFGESFVFPCLLNDAKLRIALKKGGDPNSRAKLSRETPLMRCNEAPKPAITAEVLLRNGANANLINSEGRTALILLVQQPEAAMVLIRNGCNVRLADRSGITALHRAADVGDATLIRALIKAGAAVEAKDRFGRTPYDNYLRFRKRDNATDAAVLHLLQPKSTS